MFTLDKAFEGKVKRLSLHFQDAGIDNDGTMINSATVFGTLQLFKEGDKKMVKNINFSLPMNHNKDLKNHVLSIISEAIKADEKASKKTSTKENK